MEQKETQVETPAKTNKPLPLGLSDSLAWKLATRLMPGLVGLTLVGTFLGANAISGPIQYPAFILGAWATINIALAIFTALHIIFYALASYHPDIDGSDLSGIIFMTMFGVIGTLIVSGLLFNSRHYGAFSCFLFVLLSTETFADIAGLARRRKSKDRSS